eukprot:Blabericola_migrator_1__2778@NODE_1795_length_3783_cov_34_944295_g1030_i1_p1_GENE_NODE_1795_length_3783_cov_34_944295_g1030_i1NODE_1795_length_3783_cov_34_944295_g1030_i1_p1_ORF_typecomplete_len689_score62_31RT_RNaseH_2/PF17919_1/1_1e31RT_RNaseH/PF17917_1/2_9e31RVT_1/PF00078_27/5_5e20RVT_1/PF00078_27/6e03RVP_2/PF08284_11/2e11gagasp_proteas/PF13975_6/1_5e10Integrase_H2C2/PF17921_1/2_9e10RVP/PF00077_20/2_6e09Peptidase_A2B/PF12384_8/1_3e07Asp_protease/PF09668_10/4_6e07Asp_protease_2/PF13650_6/1_8e0
MCNMTIDALVDTGATDSVISFTLVKTLQCEIFKSSICTANTAHDRRNLKIVGYTDINAIIGATQHALRFYVIEDLREPCILGMRQLQQMKVAIDLSTTTLTLSALNIASVTPIKIDTGQAKPIKDQGGRIPQHLMEPFKEELRNMEQHGIIRKSSSPWVSRVKIVPKPDGKLRICGTYTSLNKVTIKDSYPLPRIDDILDALQPHQYFIKLDLQKGFWQIPLDEDSKPKTAFRTPFGLYEFNVLPFGASNSPPAFQRILDEVLGELIGSICRIYVDDIIIFGETREEVTLRANLVKVRLSENGFTINDAKSDQEPKEYVTFVGYRIGKGTITPTKDKLQTVLTAPPPKTLRALRSFLGFANTYRKFIKNFATIVKPLQELRDDKNKKINKWTTQADTAFVEIKQRLTDLPVLNLPHPDRPYVLDTDASSIGVGAILQQEDEQGNLRPIAYASRAFRGPEKNWAPRDLEAFAIVWAVKHFSHYLIGSRFTIRTDHHSLKWLFESDRGRPGRWNALLADYDCRIVYRPGTQMEHVDYISRHAISDDLTTEILEQLDYDDTGHLSIGMIALDQREDNFRLLGDNIYPIYPITTIELQEKQREDPQGKRLLEQGILIKNLGLLLTQDFKQYIPQSLRDRILHDTHTRHHQHYGIRKTINILTRTYWWPNLRSHVRQFIDALILSLGWGGRPL